MSVTTPARLHNDPALVCDAKRLCSGQVDLQHRLTRLAPQAGEIAALVVGELRQVAVA